MEPLTAAVGIVMAIFFKEAFKESGKYLGEITSKKAGELTSSVKNTVMQKFKQKEMAGFLAKAKNNPTEKNITIIEGELLEEMKEDQKFASDIQDLIEKMKEEGVIKEQSTTQSTFIENKVLDFANSSGQISVDGGISIGDVSQGNSTH